MHGIYEKWIDFRKSKLKKRSKVTKEVVDKFLTPLNGKIHKFDVPIDMSGFDYRNIV